MGHHQEGAVGRVGDLLLRELTALAHSSLGFCNPHIPEEYGGSGLGALTSSILSGFICCSVSLVIEHRRELCLRMQRYRHGDRRPLSC